MNLIEITEGLKNGKWYQLPGWYRFYMYAVGNELYIKSKHTEPLQYSLHISELDTNDWEEVTEESLENERIF